MSNEKFLTGAYPSRCSGLRVPDLQCKELQADEATVLRAQGFEETLVLARKADGGDDSTFDVGGVKWADEREEVEAEKWEVLVNEEVEGGVENWCCFLMAGSAGAEELNIAAPTRDEFGKVLEDSYHGVRLPPLEDDRGRTEDCFIDQEADLSGEV